MRGINELKRRLASGGLAVGTWCVIPSPDVADILASSGLDFLIIDMEHGPTSYETAQHMAQAAESRGASPLIRVPDDDPAGILRALETGAHGVVVPGVTDPVQAEAIVQAVKYPPRGRRGLSPFTRSSGFTSAASDKIPTQQNEQTLCVLIVEGKEGLAAFGSIAAVPDVDVVYVGTYDLSQVMGHPGQPRHPEVQAAVRSCAQAAARSRVTLGCLVESKEELESARELGVRFLAYSADCALLAQAAQGIVQAVRRP
jgi:4-hydroxy-2-oxoheptanedioate aldolase